MSHVPLLASPVYEARTEDESRSIVVTAVGGDAATVEDALGRTRDLLAAFDPDLPSSDLFRANAQPGRPTRCSLETALLASVLSLAGADIDARLNGPVIVVRGGRRIDPGRIAVALVIDMVVHDLEDAGVAAAAVRVGTDMRVSGSAPYSDGWSADVGDDTWVRDRPILTYPDDVLHSLLPA